MISVESFSSAMQTFLQFGQLCVMLWAFKAFLTKPHDTLEERVAVLEAKQNDQDKSLMRGNNRFDDIATITEVLIRATSALIDFEAHYCETEHKPISKDLEKAKEDLDGYLMKLKRF